MRLDDGGAALHPVAAVEVVDAALEDAVGGVVDVAADDAVGLSAARLCRHRLLEGADEGHRLLDAVLEVGRERPVAEPQMAPHPVQGVVEPQCQLVAAVAQEGKPLGGAHHHVELVAVHDDVAPPLGGGVHIVAMDLDSAELHAGVVAQALVVVARDQDEARALAHLAHQLLQHVVVGLRPDRAAPHAPEIDDVADQVEDFRLALAQQVEQLVGAGSARSEMDIGDEQGPHADRRGMIVRNGIIGIFHRSSHKGVLVAGV
jgi:hypothetical protein